jgi:hypothetical protein
LWRIRGTVPVPPEADDPAIISRVGDNLEAMGRVIEEETCDRVRFSEAYGDKAPGEVDELTVFEEGEVRRQEVHGKEVLRYDLRLSAFPVFVLLWIVLQIGRFLWGVRDLPGTLAVVGLGALLFLVHIYRRWRKDAVTFLNRTFEN